jgi:hypothetical protein
MQHKTRSDGGVAQGVGPEFKLKYCKKKVTFCIPVTRNERNQKYA